MVVLDTCVVVWLAEQAPVLSDAATAGIANARRAGSLCIAGVTLWELAWLLRKGRISVTTTPEIFLAEVEARFRVLPITAFIAQIAATLPTSYPADPMDRIIGATALAYGAPLITKDKAVRQSGAVSVLW